MTLPRAPLAIGLLLMASGLVSCGPAEPSLAGPAPPPPPPSGEPFLDVTTAVGIDFRHSFGDDDFDNIVESVGSGAAWLDVNGNGHLDLYLVNQSWLAGVSDPVAPKVRQGNRLFLNRGDGTFVDATDWSRTGDTGFGYAVAVADFDNDGDPDLYVANCGVNRFYKNRGNGVFDEVAAQAGVADARCSAGATWLDFDGDGLLDLYVANYLTFDPDYRLHYAPDVYPGPLAYEAEPDALYRNRGDGTFEEVTLAAGLAATPARAMGVSSSDFTGNGWPDLFVANDATENFLFLNDGTGRFREAAVEAGVALGFYGEATAAMAGAIGDFDGDGLPDILVTDTSYGSLYRNTPHGLFEDLVIPSGLASIAGQWVSWGGGFFDFDNSGALDIFLVNGDLKRATGRPDLLLHNLGNGSFAPFDGGSYFRSQWPGRGGAFADYNNNGRMDVLVTNLGERPVLLRNDLESDHHWIRLTLEGRRSNRDGFGARVTVRAAGREWVRVHAAPAGYLSQGDPRLHFGLGSAATVDSLEIRWPSGEVQVAFDLEVDRPYRIVEGEEIR